jgi:hypothetical protein
MRHGAHAFRQRQSETSADQSSARVIRDDPCVTKIEHDAMAAVISTRLSGFDTSFHFQT